MQLIQKLRDDKKCMKKVDPSSRSKAIEDVISIGSFVEALVLNLYVVVSMFVLHLVQLVATSSGGMIHQCVKGQFRLLRSHNELEEILAMVEEKRRKLLTFLIISWVLMGLSKSMKAFEDLIQRGVDFHHTEGGLLLEYSEWNHPRDADNS
ncbi:hypothetical protein Tco_0564688 [Tanacetum coccineum]